MRFRLLKSASFRTDVLEAATYLSDRDQKAARKYRQALDASFRCSESALLPSPSSGVRPDIRVSQLWPYLIFYRVEGDSVYLERLIHGSRARNNSGNRNLMSKRSLTFVCQNCGAVYNRWQGKCDSCGEWNSIAEEASAVVGGGSAPVASGGARLKRGRVFPLESLQGTTDDARAFLRGSPNWTV